MFPTVSFHKGPPLRLFDSTFSTTTTIQLVPLAAAASLSRPTSFAVIRFASSPLTKTAAELHFYPVSGLATSSTCFILTPELGRDFSEEMRFLIIWSHRVPLGSHLFKFISQVIKLFSRVGKSYFSFLVGGDVAEGNVPRHSPCCGLVVFNKKMLIVVCLATSLKIQIFK